MRYEVTGANRADGGDVMRVYEAADEEEATRRANADGIVVQSVDLLIDLGQAASIAQPTLAAFAAQRRVAPPKLSSPAKAKPAVAEKDRAAAEPAGPPGAPAYRGLRIAGHVLLGCAIACYAVAAIAFLATLATAALVSQTTATFNVRPGLEARAAAALVWIAAFSPTLALGVAGAIAHGASAACAALRDVARNSWR